MPRQWTPQVDVTADLATTLITSQFPKLKPVTARFVARGWDNTVYRVNNRFVFRFPHRQLAADLIPSEMAVLPIVRLAQPPLAFPVIRFAGHVSANYPWRFLGYDWIEGRPAEQAGLTDRHRAAAAPLIAAFLRVLHDLPPAGARRAGLPCDTLRRLDVAYRAPRVGGQIDALAAAGLIEEPDRLRDIMSEAEQTEGTPHDDHIVHGDLHLHQLIVDGEAGLTGVIDWGDAHLGDPAVDLSVVFSLLPPDARAAFWSVYGEQEASGLALARFRALCTTVNLLDQAQDLGDTIRLTEAQRSLRNLAG